MVDELVDELVNEVYELEGIFVNRVIECCDLLLYLKCLVYEVLFIVVSMD